MHITYYPGSDSSLDYPCFGVVDGSTSGEILMVKARVLGVTSNAGDDFNLSLSTNSGETPSLPVPCIPDGAWIVTDVSDTLTMPPYVRSLILQVYDTGAVNVQVYLQAANLYAPGEIIYVKDGFGLVDGGQITVYANGSDTVDTLNRVNINGQYGSVALMSDGVANWSVVSAVSPQLYGGNYYGCSGIEI